MAFFTEKQKAYLREADHRWNIKAGATRSGKTYLDLFMIPKRIRALKDDGLIVLIGHTVGTLCRNLLDPMRELFGEYPVFLFDDVLSELDSERRRYILSGSEGKQIIITSCSRDESDGFTDREIDVSEGKFTTVI